MLGAPVLLVPIMERFGWQSGFYALAAAGILLALPAVLLTVRDRPPGAPAPELPSGPRLARVFGDPRVRLLLAAGIVNNIVALGFLSWLPTFLVTARGLPYADLAWAVSLPYAVSLVGLVFFAWLGDRSRRRALVAAVGYGLGGAALFAALSTPDLVSTLAFYGLASLFIAAYPASEFAMLQDVLPDGSVAADTGLYNGLSTMIGGGAGPFVVSTVLGEPGTGGTGHLIIPGLCLTMAAILIVADMAMRRTTQGRRT